MPRQVFFSKLLAGSFDGAVHIAGVGIGHSGEQFARGGVDHVYGPALFGIFPAPVDEQFAGMQLRFEDITHAHAVDSMPDLGIYASQSQHTIRRARPANRPGFIRPVDWAA